MGMVSLIVMENGSEWPGRFGEFDNLVAVGGFGEQSLVERARRRLELLQRRGQQVRIAVLACSDAADAASNGCREELAGELLDAVAVDPFGWFVLTSPGHASMHLRREILGLAGVLSEKLDGKRGATVSVRFGNASDDRLATVRKCMPEAFTARDISFAS